MTHYTVCCGYASHYHNAVTVEADTLSAPMRLRIASAALEKAIEQARRAARTRVVVGDTNWTVRG